MRHSSAPPRLPAIATANSKFIFAAFATTLIIATTPTSQAQVLVNENYENYSVGSNVYSGSWQFIHADTTFSTTAATSLNIDNSASSPVGGNYLTFTTGIGDWSGTVITSNTSGASALLTDNPWESSVGHFYRTMSLNAGQTYEVSLWRRIEYTGNATENTEFSIWDANGLDHTNPFLNTPSNLLNDRPYDLATGGWQHVDLMFTVPGAPGSGTHDVAFMMGYYAPTTLPSSSFGWSDYDGDFRTVDTMPSGWSYAGTSASTTETSRYSIDGFTVQAVPEPSSMLMIGVGCTLFLTRRSRR